MPALIAIRDAEAALDGNDSWPSPTKEKAGSKGDCIGRSPISIRRAKLYLGALKSKLFLAFCVVCGMFFVNSKISSFMGWIPHEPSSVYSPHRGGYTVLINAKRNSHLKKSVTHYLSCGGTNAIHVAWSGIRPPSNSLKAYLKNIVFSKSQTAQKSNFRFNVDEEGNLNSRFKPIEGPRSDAIFSVDGNVIVSCRTLDFAFTVWQTAPNTMVGFVPRMHWLEKQKHSDVHYRYGGWWSVWWAGTYSMVLPKAAFFHRKYLELYTYNISASIHDYVSRERNCEDIALSLLVANATGAPPIWVKGKVNEIEASGIRDLKDQSGRKEKCLNDFMSLFGNMPLVSTRAKAVNARTVWLW